MTDDELDDIDLSVTHAIQTLYSYGVSRTQAERALRERIAIMFEALDEFEESTRPDCGQWHPPQRVH